MYTTNNIRQILTAVIEELYFTYCKDKIASKLIHQHFLCVEVDIDANVSVTCWLSTWWCCSSIYTWGACRWYIPDIKVIWCSIESQSGKASDTVTVAVQCGGSQGDSCGEYEQLLLIPPSTPHIIDTASVLLWSKVRISQFKLGAITVNVFIENPPARRPSGYLGTATLSSIDRVTMISIL